MNDLNSMKTIDAMFTPTPDAAQYALTTRDLNKKANGIYQKKRIEAIIKSSLAKLNKNSNQLEELGISKDTQNFDSLTDQGLQVVEIEKIRGSENRCYDFDKEFRPISGRTRQCWIRLAVAMMRGEEFPPVELVQIGELFYVRDGHHRISVARALGQLFIDAIVLR